jgi:predicted transcriptional regulator
VARGGEMKAILMSVRPEWVAKILNGEKTIEIRKTAPKCELPVEVYIYCTAGKAQLGLMKFDRKVVAKFTLKKVVEIADAVTSAFANEEFTEWNSYNLEKACTHYEDLYKYANGGKIYAWHIDDLVVFDEPMKLSEFGTACKSNTYCDSFDSTGCERCKDGKIMLERPPQSWQYIEV